MSDLSLQAGYDAEFRAARRRHIASRVAVYGFLSVFALIYLLPLVVVVLNSFRDGPEIAQNGLIGLPRSYSFSAWPKAWSTYCVSGTCEGVHRNFYNSLVMTIPATIISTMLGAINGYILSKWRFKGSEWIFGAIMMGVFMPAVQNDAVDRPSASSPTAAIIVSSMPPKSV